MNIHWIPVLTMTIFSFVLGALWHQPFLFGKTWMKENNLSNPKETLNLPVIFGTTGFVHFVALCGLNVLISDAGYFTGLVAGLIISVVFILPAFTSTYLFAGKSFSLLLIDSGFYIILFALSGLVFGIW